MRRHALALVRAPRWWFVAACMLALAGVASAHGVAEGDLLRAGQGGARPGLFAYLGAKHMVTGVDHLLFLVGVVFLLRRGRDVALQVSAFAAGHSLTLLWGVLSGVGANTHAVDALIGLSVAYKAFDNLGGLRNTPLHGHATPAIFAFGLVHGLGLSTRLQEAVLPTEGLVANLLSFNLGVELGQLIALSLMVAVLGLARRSSRFGASAVAVNGLLMTLGFTLMLSQAVLWRMA